MSTIKFSFLMLIHAALSAASANGLAAAEPGQEEDVKTTPISCPVGMKFLVPQKHRRHQTLTMKLFISRTAAPRSTILFYTISITSRDNSRRIESSLETRKADLR